MIDNKLIPLYTLKTVKKAIEARGKQITVWPYQEQCLAGWGRRSRRRRRRVRRASSKWWCRTWRVVEDSANKYSWRHQNRIWFLNIPIFLLFFHEWTIIGRWNRSWHGFNPFPSSILDKTRFEPTRRDFRPFQIFLMFFLSCVHLLSL